jgi:hypothetical protein
MQLYSGVSLSHCTVPNVPNVPDEYAADHNLPLGHSVQVNNTGLVNGRLRHKKATTNGTNHITAFILNAPLHCLRDHFPKGKVLLLLFVLHR